MKIRLTLGAYLERHDISAYRVVKESRGKLAQNTVYAMARKPAQRVDLDTIGEVLTALERIQGQPVGIMDVLDVQEKPDEVDAETRAWMDSDLSRLGEIEPYDWGDQDPNTLGQPVTVTPDGRVVIGKAED